MKINENIVKANSNIETMAVSGKIRCNNENGVSINGENISNQGDGRRRWVGDQIDDEDEQSEREQSAGGRINGGDG